MSYCAAETFSTVYSMWSIIRIILCLCAALCLHKELHRHCKKHFDLDWGYKVQQSYRDNGRTEKRRLLMRRKPQGSPFSRWGCTTRAEAIRPALILHLLSSISVPSSRSMAAPKPRRLDTYPSKKNPDRAQ